MRDAGWQLGVGIVVVSALLALLPAGPAPLGYDPEAWLLWGRELSAGRLDLSAGPAVKPLPVLVDAVVVRAAGEGVARAVWAAAALGGLLGAAALAGRLAVAAGGSIAWGALGAAIVLTTGTLGGGALTGGAEPLAALGLLAAAAALGRARPWPAAAVLTAVCLIRPEAGPALLLALALAIRDAPTAIWRSRAAAAAGGAALLLLATAPWIILPALAGSSTGSAAAAGASLRGGQPGLAAWPVVASLRAAGGVALLPLLTLLGGAALARPLPGDALARARTVDGVGEDAASAIQAGAKPGGETQVVRREQDASGAATAPAVDIADRTARFAVAVGLLWVITVAVLAEVGFSGEARYQAPGVCLTAVGALLLLAKRARRHGVARRRPKAGVAAIASSIALALALAAAALAGPWSDARSLARSQADLGALLADGRVQATLPSCRVVAVPEFLRPAVALRLGRSIGSLQSPDPAGADCRLVRLPPGTRDAAAAAPAGMRVIATSGGWAWTGAVRD